MPDQSPIYELTLLLSTEAAEDVRAKILTEVEAAIERGGGSVVKKTAWGTRSLAYRIDREDDAEFHLFEITAPPALLTELSHNLRITDGVLRSRIIKAIPSPEGRAAEEPAGARASGRAAEEPAEARASGSSDPDSSAVREHVSPERGSI
ncbi:MAG: 30S ribosomal protein S6 [Solirubrobacterales bacterium]|nr:30S ribosomal protein S6 [Solirubrobacterales bacterium]MBV9164537.1 30S ribosomal protein S6 [Solirubrobacterales bacterium]MBV9534827.1 30S ribosomal protein S6 [Solirubrobacterales bacterium]